MSTPTSEPGPNCRFCGAALELVFADLASSPLANSYLSAAQLTQAEKSYPLVVRV